MPPTDGTRLGGPTRRDPLWLWLLAGVLLVARVGTGVYEQRHPLQHPDFMPWVPAGEAPALASASGRPIFYYFSAEWCGPCRTMHDEVFADEKMTRTIAQFVVPVQLVDRQREDGRNPALVDSLERVHGVQAFPTLVIVGADGKALGRLEGYPGAQQVVRWVGQTSVKARIGADGGKGGASFTFP